MKKLLTEQERMLNVIKYLEEAHTEPDGDEDEDGNPIDDNGDIVEAVPIYEGEAEFTNLCTYDVMFDTTKEAKKEGKLPCIGFRVKGKDWWLLMRAKDFEKLVEIKDSI